MDGSTVIITLSPLQGRVYSILRQLRYAPEIHNVPGRCRGCIRITPDPGTGLRIGFETVDAQSMLFINSVWKDLLFNERHVRQLQGMVSALDNVPTKYLQIVATWDITCIPQIDSSMLYTLGLGLCVWVNMSIEDTGGLSQLIQMYIQTALEQLQRVRPALDGLKNNKVVLIARAHNDD